MTDDATPQKLAEATVGVSLSWACTLFASFVAFPLPWRL